MGKIRSRRKLKNSLTTQKNSSIRKKQINLPDLQNILYSSGKDLPRREIEMLNNKLATIDISIKKFEESKSPSEIYQAKKEWQIEWDRLKQRLAT